VRLSKRSRCTDSHPYLPLSVNRRRNEPDLPQKMSAVMPCGKATDNGKKWEQTTQKVLMSMEELSPFFETNPPTQSITMFDPKGKLASKFVLPSGAVLTSPFRSWLRRHTR